MITNKQLIKEKQAKTSLHTFMILDNSASMKSVEGQVRDGLKEYFSSQQDSANDDELFSLYLFSNTLEPQIESGRLKDLEMDTAQYRAEGMSTSLYDAVGGVIFSNLFKKSLQTSEKVLLVVQTDGQENSSRKYNSNVIKDELDRLRKLPNVTFIFLGADADGWSNTSVMGTSSSVQYCTTKTNQVFYDLSTANLNLRSAGAACLTPDEVLSSFQNSSENK